MRVHSALMHQQGQQPPLVWANLHPGLGESGGFGAQPLLEGGFGGEDMANVLLNDVRHQGALWHGNLLLSLVRYHFS